MNVNINYPCTPVLSLNVLCLTISSLSVKLSICCWFKTPYKHLAHVQSIQTKLLTNNLPELNTQGQDKRCHKHLPLLQMLYIVACTKIIIIIIILSCKQA